MPDLDLLGPLFALLVEPRVDLRHRVLEARRQFPPLLLVLQGREANSPSGVRITPFGVVLRWLIKVLMVNSTVSVSSSLSGSAEGSIIGRLASACPWERRACDRSSLARVTHV
eukprot:1180950-Prorocentrum_minimum.AAC.1